MNTEHEVKFNTYSGRGRPPTKKDKTKWFANEKEALDFIAQPEVYSASYNGTRIK
jgi:hypothetical protein